MNHGILILDNSCYRHLQDSAPMQRLKSNMRAAGLEPGPSEMNLLEAIATPHPPTNARLIELIREFASGAHLLEWPFEVLRRIGEGIVAGETFLPLAETGREWLLDDAEARESLRADVAAFNREIEARFNEVHASARQGIQRRLKAQRHRFAPEGLRAFLDEEWPQTAVFHEFASATWSQLGLPGDVPVDEVLSALPWRLYLDGEGSAVYHRALSTPQPSFVQRRDLLQLVYLGLHGRRILATADEPFRETAHVIVSGRYPGARVVHIRTMTT